MKPTAFASLLAILLAGAGSIWSGTGDLFPQPFVVEHHMVQRNPGAGDLVGESVVDHYVGSRIISERPDGSRMIVDLARRELVEVDPGEAAYTVIGFERMAELQRRLARAERMQVGIVDGDEATADPQSAGDDPEPRTEPRFTIEVESAGKDGLVSEKAASLLERKGVERLVIRLARVEGEEAKSDEPAVEVWIDPSVRLSEVAREALARFERDVLAATADQDRVPFSRYIAAARDHGKGAFPIRIRRPSTSDPAKAMRSGTVETIATRLELEASLPEELLTIPDGYRRRPHPLEAVVAFSEEEAERNLRSLAGAR